MQQISTIIKGNEFDYTKVRGGTGPLVYPAGHVWIYSVLWWVTDQGSYTKRAQWIFGGVYVSVTAVVLAIYRQVFVEEKKRKRNTEGDGNIQENPPVWIVGLLVLSKRVMSLFVLRLFNDGFEILFVYIAILFMVKNKWKAACAFYSMAVSIKMNALLYAPAVLLLLTQAVGLEIALLYIVGVCGGVQIVVGALFLWQYPKEYLGRAFEFNRVFLHKWSVNYGWMSEKAFGNKKLAITLVVLHLGCLAVFGHFQWTPRGLVTMLKRNSSFLGQDTRRRRRRSLSATHVALTLFTCNLIGMTFTRTIHYQFYLWYFHTLPFLLWKMALPVYYKIAVLVVTEYVFNTYPPKSEAGLGLHLSHLLMLQSLWERPRVSDGDVYDASKDEKRLKRGD